MGRLIRNLDKQNLKRVVVDLLFLDILTRKKKRFNIWLWLLLSIFAIKVGGGGMIR